MDIAVSTASTQFKMWGKSPQHTGNSGMAFIKRHRHAVDFILGQMCICMYKSAKPCLPSDLAHIIAFINNWFCLVSFSELHRQLSILQEEEYPAAVCPGKSCFECYFSSHFQSTFLNIVVFLIMLR